MPPHADETTFALQVDGVTLAVFQQLTGLGYQTDVVELREGTADGGAAVRKVPGVTRWAALVLARRADGTTALREWRQLVLMGRGDEARRHGAIVQMDADSAEVTRWHFHNGWPSAWSVDAVDGTVIETVTIQHDGLTNE